MLKKYRIIISIFLLFLSISFFLLSLKINLNFVENRISTDGVLVPAVRNFVLSLTYFLKGFSILFIFFIFIININYFKNNWLLLVFFFSIIIYIFYILLFWQHTIDDMFISLRYSNHLINSGKLLWNYDSPPVEGYSNFFWIILGSLIVFFKLPPIISMKILGVISGILFLISLFLLGKEFLIEKKINRPSLLLLILILLTPFFPFWFVSGLETGLFLFLFTISIYFILKSNRNNKISYFLPLFLFFTSITRPEGAALIFFSFLFFKLKTKRLYLLFLSLILWLLYFIWRWKYFGSFLPATVICKSKIGGGINYLGNYYRFLLPFIPFFIIGVANKFSKKLLSLLIIMFSFIFYLVNSTAAQGGYFRFLLPSLIIFFLFTAKGILLIIPYIYKKSIWRKMISILLASFLFVYLFGYTGVINYSKEQYVKGHINGHLALAHWLKNNYPENSSMALVDCGYIPYYTDFKTYDLFGLNNIYIAKNGISSEYIFSLKPDLIILASLDSSVFISRFPAGKTIYSDSTFLTKYKKVIHFNRIFYYLWVFEKND